MFLASGLIAADGLLPWRAIRICRAVSSTSSPTGDGSRTMIRPRRPWSCSPVTSTLFRRVSSSMFAPPRPASTSAPGIDSLPLASSVTRSSKSSARSMLATLPPGGRSGPGRGGRVTFCLDMLDGLRHAPAGERGRGPWTRTWPVWSWYGLGPGTKHGGHPRHHHDPGQAGAPGHGACGDPVNRARWAGRANAVRLIRLALPAVLALLILAVAVAVAGTSRPAAAARSGAWVTSWSASPQEPTRGAPAAAGFHDQTIREIVFTSVGGDPIRLVLSNAFGAAPLLIGRVTVAMAALSAEVVPGTIHPVTFGGRPSIRIPAGEQVLSDAVGIQVWPLEDLTVSVYLPGRTGPATLHAAAQQVNWISVAGDHAGEAGSGAFVTPTRSSYYLSGLQVRSSGAAGTVVAFGDSITDGVQSTVDRNARWPNDLARRLDALGGRTLAVADQGIGGNRVLDSSRCCGASAVARFTRDALDQPGVRDVIVLEGINDIGFLTRRRHLDADI